MTRKDTEAAAYAARMEKYIAETLKPDPGAKEVAEDKRPRSVRRRVQLIRRKMARKQYAHPEKQRRIAYAFVPTWGTRPKGGERSRYRIPHQGERECARRIRQLVTKTGAYY